MVIKVTSQAYAQLAKINKPREYIKLFVSSGGCSGIQWGLTPVAKESIHSRDEVVNEHLVVDNVSVFHLLNSELDYKTSLKASEFIISNPNASHQCGCGKSFTVS